MKASVSAVCATAVVVLVSALAESRTPSKLEPASLARIEAITSYCEKVDPNADSQYLSKLAGAVSGRPEDEIQRDRTTADYQKAMAQANETLAKASHQTAVTACSEFLKTAGQ